VKQALPQIVIDYALAMGFILAAAAAILPAYLAKH
jgi:hypothetical protein